MNKLNMNKKYLIPLLILVVVVGGLLIYFRIEQNKLTEARERLLTNGFALKDDKKAFGQFLLDNESEMRKIVQEENIFGIQIKARPIFADESYYNLWCAYLLDIYLDPEGWMEYWAATGQYPNMTASGAHSLAGSYLSAMECEL